MGANPTASTQTIPSKHYLNASYGIRSWLLTTAHKRIALLYLGSVTGFFFSGGPFTGPARVPRLTPTRAFGRPRTHQKPSPVHVVSSVLFSPIAAPPTSR